MTLRSEQNSSIGTGQVWQVMLSSSSSRFKAHALRSRSCSGWCSCSHLSCIMLTVHSYALMLLPVGTHLIQASCLLISILSALVVVCRQGWWTWGLSGVSSILGYVPSKEQLHRPTQAEMQQLDATLSLDPQNLPDSRDSARKLELGTKLTVSISPPMCILFWPVGVCKLVPARCMLQPRR